MLTAVLLALLVLFVVVVALLMLAVVKFDPPASRDFLKRVKSDPSSSAGMQWARIVLSWFLFYVFAGVYYSGYVLVVGGLALVLMYPFGKIPESLDRVISGIGTGLTMYAAGFALVALIGKSIDIEQTPVLNLNPYIPNHISQRLDSLSSNISDAFRLLRQLLWVGAAIVVLLCMVLTLVIYTTFIKSR